MEPKEWMKHKQQGMKYQMDELMKESQTLETHMLQSLSASEEYDYLVSKMNFCQRKELNSSLDLGVRVHIGDICFVDYGLAYILEIGYLHFGLILAMQHGKAFIVPVSGNYRAYLQAYAPDHKQGKRHLMRLGCIPGMNKVSVLYMNDAKWINTARIIDVKAHLDPREKLFQEIKGRIVELIVS